MQQTGDSPVIPVSDRDLDEVLRSLEIELLYPELALPRQAATSDRTPTSPAA